MDRKWILLVVFFLMAMALLSTAEAKIAVSGPYKDSFNLGDKIVAAIDVSNYDNSDLFIKANLKCTNYELLYYTTPVSFAASKQIRISPAPVAVKPSMLGICTVEFSLENYEKEVVESVRSADFTVTNNLDVTISTDKDKYLPKDKLKLSGAIKSSFDEFPGVDVKVTLNGVDKTFSAKSSNVSYTIIIPENIKSKTNALDVVINDSFGNSYQKTFEIQIAPVPTKLALNLNQAQYNPGETVVATASLLDQAGDPIEKETYFEVYKGDNQLSKRTASNRFEYKLDNYAEPGAYVVKAKNSGLSAEKPFTVKVVKTASYELDGTKVKISNLGNVLFEESVKLTITKDGNNYDIEKKLKLLPGKSYEFDLDYELPSGKYAVALGTETKETVVTDKRSLAKKTAQGFDQITGNMLRTSNGALVNVSIIAFIAIIAVLVALYIIKGHKFNSIGHQKQIQSFEQDNLVVESNQPNTEEVKSVKHKEALFDDNFIEYKDLEQETNKETKVKDRVSAPVEKPKMEKPRIESKRRERAEQKYPDREDPFVKSFVEKSLKEIDQTKKK